MRQHSVGRRRVRTLCLAFGGLRVRKRALRYEREALAQGRARRPWFNAQFRARTPPPVPSRPMCTKAGLSWSGVVHVEDPGPAMDGARQIARRADAQRSS